MPADASIYTGMRPSSAFGGNFNELDQLSFLRHCIFRLSILSEVR